MPRAVAGRRWENDVPVRGEVMAVVLRPGLRCRGKGEDEHRQDRGDADVGGRRPAIAATKRIELGSLLRERNARERPCVIVPRDAEGLCFRVGIATPLAVERLQTQKVDFDVGQIHRGLHYTTSITLLKFELHLVNHELSITLRVSRGLPKPSSNFSISRRVQHDCRGRASSRSRRIHITELLLPALRGRCGHGAFLSLPARGARNVERRAAKISPEVAARSI